MRRENVVKFRVEQIWELFKLTLAWFISFFVKKEELWLVSERGVDARDNGYWLFKYVKGFHSEINAKFIISKDSPDRRKLSEYEKDLVEFKSIRHYVLLWKATHLISTHIQGYAPFVGLGLWLRKMMRCYDAKYHVFLQHGITINLTRFLYYDNTRVDLLIAGAKPEYDFFCRVYGYPDKIVKFTGFCRFDQLATGVKPKRQILVMPTWREWIYEKKKFEQSEFTHKYHHFLQNTTLQSFLEDYHIDLVFYLHHEMQPYVDTYILQHYGSQIVIAKETDYDIQQLLIESSLLITDYSSVSLDFAYMLKPVVFYQFDSKEYRKNHYDNGWFDYYHGFGTVVESENDLITTIVQSCHQHFTMEDQYKAYVDKCFPFRDGFNTKRVFDCIRQLSVVLGWLMVLPFWVISLF